jgi:hypothetical protein
VSLRRCAGSKGHDYREKCCAFSAGRS